MTRTMPFEAADRHSKDTLVWLMLCALTVVFFGFASVRLIESLGGYRVSDNYKTDAYGNVLATSGVSSNTYRFAGEQFDRDLDSYFLRSRYLIQASGRFLSFDKYEGGGNAPSSLHKYMYTNGNPVTGLDPSGMMTVAEAVVVSGMIEVLGAIACVHFVGVPNYILLSASYYSVSPKGKEFIASWEKTELSLYNDKANDIDSNPPDGNATIGIGHLVHIGPLNPNDASEAPFRDGITDTEARRIFNEDLEKHTAFLKADVIVPLRQREFDAFASLYFNVDPAEIAISRTLRHFNNNRISDSAVEWVGFNRSGGKVMRGLTNRRNAEVDILLRGKYVNHQ